MTTKHTILIVLSTIILCSCSKDKAELIKEIPYTAKVLLSTKAGTSLDVPENAIDRMDLYTFRKKNGENDYTFEKKFSNCTINDYQNGKSIDLQFDGSIERIAYFVANASELDILALSTLSSTTTNTQFENQLIFINNAIPVIPLAMASMQTLPAQLSSTPIEIKLEHALACLDINNQYNGFTVDSIVLKDALSGSFLLKSEIPSAQQVARTNINYGTGTQLYMFQTDASVLAVYGKYLGIRAVFDILLNDIKKGTRYQVTFRSVNDADVNFASNLKWDVTPWGGGSSVESTPDWKQ